MYTGEDSKRAPALVQGTPAHEQEKLEMGKEQTDEIKDVIFERAYTARAGSCIGESQYAHLETTSKDETQPVTAELAVHPR